MQDSIMSTLFLIQLLNGLQLGVLLFLLAAGLTLVFGIMDFVNLAHGSLYMIGAFICASLTFLTGSFVWGVLLAIPIVAVIGYFFEVLIVRHLYESNHLDHVLATFGIILIADTLVQLTWGPEGIAIPLPDYLSGQVEILPDIIFPTFRLVIISSGLLIAAGLYWLITYTRLGMLIRAGASNRTMVSALGVDISTLFAGVFALGAVLAGVAGMLIAPITEATIGMGNDIIITAFVVIIVGGIGSMKGAWRALLQLLLGLHYLRCLFISSWPLSLRFDRKVFSRQRCAKILPLLAWAMGNKFYLDFSVRMICLAIAAVSLNLILGFGGMVSFGHAAFVGIGAYAVGIPSYHGYESAWLHFPLAMIAAALFALITGAISLRTKGVYFIMITMAFAQMAYISDLHLHDVSYCAFALWYGFARV